MDVIIFMTLLQVIILIVFIFMILEAKKTLTTPTTKAVGFPALCHKEGYYRHSKRNQNGKFIKKEEQNGN